MNNDEKLGVIVIVIVIIYSFIKRLYNCGCPCPSDFLPDELQYEREARSNYDRKPCASCKEKQRKETKWIK